jgi:hypothetical protein
MKKISVLLIGALIFSLALTFSGCSLVAGGISKATRAAATGSSPSSGRPQENVIVKSDDGSVSITVPEGWETNDADLSADACISVSNAADEQYVIVIEEARDDFADDFTADDYLAALQEKMTEKSANAAWSRISEVTIGGLDGLTVELSATVDGYDIVYWVYVVEGKDNFYQIAGWTAKNEAAANSSVINNVIASFEETATAPKGV